MTHRDASLSQQALCGTRLPSVYGLSLHPSMMSHQASELLHGCGPTCVAVVKVINLKSLKLKQITVVGAEALAGRYANGLPHQESDDLGSNRAPRLNAPRHPQRTSASFVPSPELMQSRSKLFTLRSGKEAASFFPCIIPA